MRMQKLLCTAALVALVAPSSPGAQGLAGAAKKEKERRAKERAMNGEAKIYAAGPGAPEDPTAEVDPSSEKATPSPAPLAPRNKAAGQGPRSSVSKEVATARSNRSVSVILYVTSWCQYCRRAREFLAGQPNVRVEVHDVEANKARNKEMLSKTGGADGVPVIDVEGTIIKGYSREAIIQALASARNR